jgi:hypothetical protein
MYGLNERTRKHLNVPIGGTSNNWGWFYSRDQQLLGMVPLEGLATTRDGSIGGTSNFWDGFIGGTNNNWGWFYWRDQQKLGMVPLEGPATS